MNKMALKQKDLELEKIQTKTQKTAGKEMAKPYRHSHISLHIFTSSFSTLQPANEITVWRSGFEFRYKQGSQWCVISCFRRGVN